MITRREFLKGSAATVFLGLAYPSVFTAALRASATGLDPAVRDRILVVVQMAGGNDGLNTVIPFGDGRYYDARPTIAIPEDRVLPLADGLGLHPGLAALQELWDGAKLAIVQGVGYPNPNLSHFRSMEIWQTANFDQRLIDGWLGRTFERMSGQGQHTLAGLAVGNALPLALRSPKGEVGVVQSLESHKIQGDPAFPFDAAARARLLMQMYATYPASAPYGGLFPGVSQAAFDSVRRLQEAAGGYQAATEYPRTALGGALGLVAKAVAGGMGARVFHVGTGGFDTHAAQPTIYARLLSELAEALRAFYRDLDAHGKAEDVLILTWSEFGRRVKENANAGTDHGAASTLFLLGGRVKGGLYGEAPKLKELQDGNLRYTVDFRSVYASALDLWLGVSAEEILGGRFERLPYVL